MRTTFMRESIICCGIVLFFGLAHPAHAAVPPGFVSTEYAKMEFLSTDMVFAPDGRLFVLDKNGSVRIFENGKPQTTPALTLNVSAEKERGLLGIAFDPGFSRNQYLYLFYTTGPGSAKYSGTPRNRLARFQMSASNANIADPKSEKILLDNIASDAGVHNAGDVGFGPDGKLYMSTGDGGKVHTKAQDLSNLNGKILRINADGTIPADNPYAGKAGKRGEIWAYGLRNPWRFTFDQKTGTMFIADVGAGGYEEVNVGKQGANYGWPQTEGPLPKNISGVTYPAYSYAHGPSTSASIIGGVVYRGANFPKSYDGSYFFGDFGGGFVRRLTFNSKNEVTKAEDFDPKGGWMVTMVQGPDDALYYFVAESPASGRIQRVAYTGVKTGGAAPSPQLFVSRSAGRLPFAVTFSAKDAGSEKQSVTYRWDYGDGATGKGAVTQHTFTQKGSYTVTLTARNANGVTAQSFTSVYAGDTPPVPVINVPANGLVYQAGDVIRFSGAATDAEEGTLSAQQLQWDIVLRHLDHFHPGRTLQDKRSGTFTIPRDGEASASTRYDIILTAVDRDGVEASVHRAITPRKRTFILTSNVGNAPLLLDGSPVPKLPYGVRAVVNFPRSLSAPVSFTSSDGTSYAFVRWSDGKPREHAMVPEDKDNVEYTAYYERTNE